MSDQTPQTPAGWYPAEEGRIRWWDGTAWTEHYQDSFVPAPVVEPTPVVSEPVVAEPEVVEPVVVEPVVVEPAVVEPVIAPVAEPVAEAPAVAPTPVFEAPTAVPPTAVMPTAEASAPQVASGQNAGGVPPIPSPGGVPPYAAAGAAASGAGGLPPQPPKKSLAWLWFLLGGIALLFIIGIVVLLAVIVPIITNAAGPSPQPTQPIIETLDPVDPTDPVDPGTGGDFTNAEQSVIDDVRADFPDLPFTDADIVEVGYYACEVAESENPVGVADVVDFSTTVLMALRADEYTAASADDQYILQIDTGIQGEIGIRHLCEEHYQTWWDAVELLITEGPPAG